LYLTKSGNAIVLVSALSIGLWLSYQDSDNDGVPYYRDACPDNTSLEIATCVSSSGCPSDADEDGVPDYRDDCPDNTIAFPDWVKYIF
jgi:hypothetical protein